MAEWIGTVGGIAGILTALIAIYEWWKINKKIAMLTDSSRAAEILPAWYTSRMMSDDWLFGLLTSDGRMIAITKITAVSDNGKWMDVCLATSEQANTLMQKHPNVLVAVANDRLSASIQIAKIVAAMEVQSS